VAQILQIPSVEQPAFERVGRTIKSGVAPAKITGEY